MIVEPRACLERVDVEGMRLKTRNRGSGEAAAKREDEPVIGQDLRSAVYRANDLSLDDIDVRDLRYGVLDADRVEHIGKRNERRVEIDFIIADADRMRGG